MPRSNTPPSSPLNFLDMDEDEVAIHVEDIEEVIDLNIGDAEGLDSDNSSSSGESVRLLPERDDAALVFRNHADPVFCCNLEPKEAKFAVTGGQDENGYVWNTQSGDVVLHCNGHSESVTYAEFSHDGNYVATGDLGGMIKVWKMSNKSVVWETNVGEFMWMKWHHGANVLLAGTVSGEVFIWRIPSGESKVLPGHGEKSDCGLVMPDGKRAVVGYNDGSISVFDMKTSSMFQQTQKSDGAVMSMDAHSDNNLVIAGTSGGEAILLTTQTGKVVARLNCSSPMPDRPCDPSSVEAVGFCKNSSLSIAATGTLSGTLCIWDTARHVPRHVIRLNSGIVKLLWHRTKPVIFTAGLRGVVEVYDALSGTSKFELLGHEDDVLDICLSADGTTLVSASDDKTARIFNLISPAWTLD